MDDFMTHEELLAERGKAYAPRWLERARDDYRAARLDHIVEKWRVELMDWWDSESRTLLLGGPVGVGKTYAAAALGYFVSELGLFAWITTVDDLLGEALAEDSKRWPASHPCWRSDLLILDDFGATPPTEWNMHRLGDLIERRGPRRQVVITNHRPETVMDYLGARSASRLQRGMSEMVMYGPDRRVKHS